MSTKIGVFLGLILFSFSLFAQVTNKTSTTELLRLNQLIVPQFKTFKPAITDTKVFGNLTVVHLSVTAADHNEAYVIVTPDNKVIDIDSYTILAGINLKKNPDYEKLAVKFPNISIWPGNHSYPVYEKLADGAQQLQFNYRLLNGCHACEIGGIAALGFNFETSGKYLGTTLIRLSPPPVLK